MGAARSGKSPATVATLRRVKALADPLRYRVFERLIAAPRTAKQMAEELGTHPTRLYHHFRVLEKAGLIRPAGTRQKRGTTEKYFTAAVNRIEAGDQSPGMSAGLAAALRAGVIESTLADVRRTGARRRAGGPAAASYVKRYVMRATPDQAAEIRAQLDELSALCERTSDSADATEFAITLAFYPQPPATRQRKRR
jgi:DNA-binding transcriptional ArsR family regulator